MCKTVKRKQPRIRSIARSQKQSRHTRHNNLSERLTSGGVRYASTRWRASWRRRGRCASTCTTKSACDSADAPCRVISQTTCRWMYYNAKTLEIRVLEHVQRCESCEELSLVGARKRGNKRREASASHTRVGTRSVRGGKSE